MANREKYLNITKNALGDKYIFSDEIKPCGEGGTGIVYKANQVFGKDENIFAKRAIKFFIFRDDLIEKWGIVSINNFRTEIKNITQFNHQNILKVIDGDFYSIEIDGTVFEIPYTVTEYIDGENLDSIFAEENRDLCRRYIKNEEVVFDIFLEIIDAVQYLHNNNFYHCDIAPKNIFLKIGKDEGIFAILGDLGSGNTIDEKMNTRIRIIGTSDYMPENVKKLKNLDVSSNEFSELQPQWDIYSTICTFRMIINKIKENKIISSNIWNLERLYEKLTGGLYNSIADLRNDIEYLRPSSGQILNLDELSEASSNITSFLIPCGCAMLSYRIKKLIKHDAMLRLMDVPQLLEGAMTFPGANHTRYEHSLGTYELMRRAILALLRNRDYVISLSEKHVVLALLGALLSSLANYPYSYAIQELRVQSPDIFQQVERRKIFSSLLNRKDDISGESLLDCIHELFPKYDIKEEDIEYVVFGKQNRRNRELDNLHSLLNSSIGVRIIDYIVRDAHHIGISCRIETDNLFNNLAIHKGEFCLKQGGIPSAEQIIANRSWMFKRIYWSDPNRANAALLKYLFYVVYCDCKELDRLLAEEVIGFDCTKKSIQNILIENCSIEKKEHVKSIINFINHKGRKRYKSILVLDSNSNYVNANISCDLFFEMDYTQQYEIREKLEKWFIERYHIPEKNDDGVILLMDIPVENLDNKMGKDIRVIRRDGQILSLQKASGLASGMRENFEQQLRFLRIYIRPDIYDYVFSDPSNLKEEIASEIYQQLYDLL